MEKKAYPTPHINACPSDFSKTVLMPGDPLRAKFIAEEFLAGSRLINNVRGVQGYTGSYKGTGVTVMACGMGMPSMGIYSYELFNYFNVDNIIKIGTAGALQKNLHIGDVVFGLAASSNSSFSLQYGLNGTYAPACDYNLLETAVKEAEKSRVSYRVGNILTSDTFYSADKNYVLNWSKMGVLAVEMEIASLYMTAARAGKRALGICTVSDHLLTGEQTSAGKRQNSFTDMIEIALNTAVKIDCIFSRTDAE